MQYIDANQGEKPVNSYVVLIRGINVGGNNKVPMAALRQVLETLGFSSVTTYIASGNVILKSDKPAEEIKVQIEAALPEKFILAGERIRVLVLTRMQFQAVVNQKPEGFGEEPDKFHSDVIFLMGIDSAQAMLVFDPREGVDQVWAGQGVIYSERLSARRTQSRLSKIIATTAYKSMTIRNWNTTTALLALLKRTDADGIR